MSVTGARGASGRPPVSGRPLSVFSCVPVLPMMSPPMMMHTHTGASLSVFSCVPVPPDDVAPMMMHTHTGASLSVIACVCYSCPSCPPVFLWGVGIITRKRLKHTGARERACERSPLLSVKIFSYFPIFLFPEKTGLGGKVILYSPFISSI